MAGVVACLRGIRLSPAAVLIALWVVLPSNVSRADRLDREVGDAAYRSQLLALATRCDELGLVEQGEVTRGWFAPRDERRHYLFLPAAVDAHRPRGDASTRIEFWYARFLALRQAQAERLFGLAGRQVTAGDEGSAFRLLHEVLHEDPDHAQARGILGYSRGDRGWSRPFRRPARRRTRGMHPEFGWASSQYWNIDSEHFELTTNLSARGGQQAAEYLERVHAVWQQLFYEYWSVPGRLAARFQGEGQSLGPERSFSVVLFADRAEYLRQLGRFESRIDLSVGYYSQNHKTAFFYAGDDAARTTWVHESTHQFFHESGMAALLVGERANFWAVEGVALYMESLLDRDDYATTGGADADRLQFARFRKLSQGYYVPLHDVVGYGRQQIQDEPDIRQLYSQFAGLSHFFMHRDGGRSWRPFVKYLTIVYRGVDQRETLQSEMGQDYEQLDRAYQDFLNVTDTDLAFVDPRAANLCLAHTAVTDAGLKHLRSCDQLRWLDLSFTDVTDAGLEFVAGATRMEQLNLEKTRVTDRGVELLSGMRELEELDLSQTDISDAALPGLARLHRLKILWLTGTRVTDNGLPVLSTLRNLQQLEVDATRVTPAARDQLKKRLPNLK